MPKHSIVQTQCLLLVVTCLLLPACCYLLLPVTCCYLLPVTCCYLLPVTCCYLLLITSQQIRVTFYTQSKRATADLLVVGLVLLWWPGKQFWPLVSSATTGLPAQQQSWFSRYLCGIRPLLSAAPSVALPRWLFRLHNCFFFVQNCLFWNRFL